MKNIQNDRVYRGDEAVADEEEGCEWRGVGRTRRFWMSSEVASELEFPSTLLLSITSSCFSASPDFAR